MLADHIKAGHLSPALETLQNQIRANAGDPQLRLSLCQLLCVMGQWERAAKQLEVLTSLSDEFKSWTNMMRPALHAEAIRREVFAGQTSPLVLGEPPTWLAPLIQALKETDPEQQVALRSAAFEAAPAIPATINGHDAPWIADADSRLGPVLEAAMDGKYYWIPFERIRRLVIAPPTDLRHLVWLPVEATWVTGGESTILVPTRYVDSENATDDRLRLARLTTWEEIGDGQYRGLGQRIFGASELDCPLLEARTIEMKSAIWPPVYDS